MKPTTLLYTILLLLLIVFGGFAYMHYYTVDRIPHVYACLPKTADRTIGTVELFQAMMSDNDRATSRVFALVTVLIATATLIVALQFIANMRTIKELEQESEKIKQKNEEFNKAFQDKESKLSRIAIAINKVESLAQATSYPLIITANIALEKFKGIERYEEFIEDSFTGFNKDDNFKDNADWNRILFFAKQAQSFLAGKNNTDDIDAKELKGLVDHLVAVSACKSEECTGDREEKSILLTLAIKNFRSVQKQKEDVVDKINLASVYARKGMLYATLPESYDYKEADRLFEDTIRTIENKEEELIQNAFFNWGLSWLARTAIFKQDTEKWGQDHIRTAKNNAENYLKKANKALNSHKAIYALLTLYSISGDIESCKKIICDMASLLNDKEESIPLPELHRIHEDIDLDFIRNNDKAIYKKLITLTEENDKRKRERNSFV